MSDSNLEVRVSALERQMQEIRELLQEAAANIAILTRENRATRALTESNARVIETLNAHTAEARDEAEEERSELRVNLNTLRESVEALVRLSQQNEVEYELFRRRFEAIDPLVDEE
jgi:chromosome segregation ATPase